MKGHLKQLAGFFSLLSVLLMIIIMPQGCLSLRASFEHGIYIPPSPLNVPERRVLCSVAGKYTEAHGGDGPSLGWPSKWGRVGFTPEPWRVPTSDIQEGALILPSKTWELGETGLMHLPPCFSSTQIKAIKTPSSRQSEQLSCRWENIAVQFLTKGLFKIYEELLQTNSKAQTT